MIADYCQIAVHATFQKGLELCQVTIMLLHMLQAALCVAYSAVCIILPNCPVRCVLSYTLHNLLICIQHTELHTALLLHAA